jgi:hypothetical protein
MNYKNNVLKDVLKKYPCVLLFFICVGCVQGQVIDNFSDGDFSTGPPWAGTPSSFKVNADQQLQLNDGAAGTSYLSTPSEFPSLGNFEWTAAITQLFAPSSANYGRLYLVSDQADLTKPLRGYYLQFGEAGANDAIELFRQTGSVSTSVCRGSNGAIAASFKIRIDVRRNAAGEWKILVDYTGGTNPVLDATGTDTTYNASSFFGLVCVYTSSNATKFVFDDLYAGPAIVDLAPPVLQSVAAPSATTLRLSFSETLNPRSVPALENYSCNNAVGYPSQATMEDDGKTIDLTFNTGFPSGKPYLLTVSGIEDIAGNVMTITQLQFIFTVIALATPNVIIITEVFADPTPQLGLPNAEFIEIYNRSAQSFDLSGWKLSDGKSTTEFPTQRITAGQYWIITASKNATLFASFGNVLGLTGFPTLDNDADNLMLVSPQGATIDSIAYTTTWYHDREKADGGWSLERIDLNNPCGDENNWTASEDPRGGSPGRQNSVNANQPDTTGPRLLSLAASTGQFIITFDERLDKSSSNGSFVLTPQVPVERIDFADNTLRKIRVMLTTPLVAGQRYHLGVDRVEDCNGNPIQTEFSGVEFGLPEIADSLDVILNEVLFNPRPNGVDFVEIYNRSAKYINLDNWKLANFENGFPAGIETITTSDLVLAPGSYLVFTSDPDVLKNNYPQGHDENFLTTSLPNLPDDEGTIAVLTDHGKVVDYFFYQKRYHSRLLSDDDGVSLERISFSGSTNDPENWSSASGQVGFATPGYLNSSARPDHSVSSSGIFVEPELFIPGYGAQNFAEINYEFDQPGAVINLRIMDQQGHLIKSLANNEILGTTGFFRWDGDRDDGTRARIGYYFVWAEVFDVAGQVRTFRKRVIVGTR